MLVAAIDFEANGKEPTTARITEIGAVIFDTSNGKWEAKEEFSTLVYDPVTYPPQSEEVIRITGLTDAILKKEGVHPKLAIPKLIKFIGQATKLVAYNVAYDRVLLEHEMKRVGFTFVPPLESWVCGLRDVPYPDFYTCRKLSHLALDHGLHFDPKTLHRAVNDVKLMGELLNQGGYSLEAMLEYQAMPTMVVRAIVTYEQRDLAKGRRFGWEVCPGTDRKFPKYWVRGVKQAKVDEEIAACKAAGFIAAVIGKI